MTIFSPKTWETAAAVTLLATATVGAILLFDRKRPTADELERARRKSLAQTGRLVDGMLLDVREIKADDGRTLTMLFYSYRSRGVDYECSQDITTMSEVVDAAQLQPGFPCSVRYQSGGPQNSIVVAEEWSGLRSSLPVFPAADDPERTDLRHLRPGRG